MPAQVQEIKDPFALAMIGNCRRSPVRFNLNQPATGSETDRMTTVDTAFYGPSSEQLAAYPSDAPAFVLLHSFDSSCLEFRRLVPLLSKQLPTYAVDLVRVQIMTVTSTFMICWQVTWHTCLMSDNFNEKQKAAERDRTQYSVLYLPSLSPYISSTES